MSFSSSFHFLPEQGFALCILSSGYQTDFTNSVTTAFTTLIDDLPQQEESFAYTVEPGSAGPYHLLRHKGCTTTRPLPRHF
ncbi:MAG: hypothetical protein HN348_20415 [Proteobacteria bacterium]|jgi:hypothetical protein|nr:hypothetical protein [Pseudomonadota bacterium]